ncbi:MAG: hypothetical protein ACREAE_05680 [Nitrosopumilaceae archaeon]
MKWNHIGTDGIIQGNAIAISSDGQNIVIGSMASGEVGNLYKFDKSGNILWQKNDVSGGVLNVDMSGDGSSIVVGTNNGMLLLGRDGEEIASHSTWFPTISSDGKFIASSGLIGNYEYGIAFFDGKLNHIWSIPNVGSDINKISKDGSFVVAGTRLPNYASKSDDLYFFVGGQKPASEQFFNDTTPLSPIESVLRYPSEHAGSGSPLLAWNANDAFELIIIIAAIVGITATVIFAKSRKKVTQ